MESGDIVRELVICLGPGLIQREKTYKMITFQLLFMLYYTIFIV